MSKRKTGSSAYEMTDDEPEMAELEKHAREFRRILESNGITRKDFLASMPEAKRRTFERNYPNLVAMRRDRAA